MRVQVRKLRETLGLLEPLIPKKPSPLILGNILLQGGKAIAMNHDTTVMVDLPEATESYLLPVAITDFLDHIAGSIIAEISQDEQGRLQILCGSSKSILAFNDPEVFPSPPAIPDPVLQMDGDRLFDAMVMAREYMARDDSRPTLKGVTLVIGSEKSHVAAGDGYRLFYREIPCKADSRLWIIPGEVIPLLKDLWKKTAQPDIPDVDALLTQMAIAKRVIRFSGIEKEDSQKLVAQFGKVTVVTRLITGTPPDWMKVIPTAYNTQLNVFAPDLYRAVQQAATVLGDSSVRRIILEWAGKELTVSAEVDGRIAETKVAVTVDGSDGRIAFDARYLTSYLKSREGIVSIRYEAHTHPGVFLDGKCTVVIMPMALEKTQEPKAEEPEPAAEEVIEEITDAATEETAPAGEPEETTSPPKKEENPKKTRKKATAKAKA